MLWLKIKRFVFFVSLFSCFGFMIFIFGLNWLDFITMHVFKRYDYSICVKGYFNLCNDIGTC